jgi:hypothetical protein
MSEPSTGKEKRSEGIGLRQMREPIGSRYHVCVVLDGKSWAWFERGELAEGASTTKNKLYVAFSRARGNLFLAPERLFKKHRLAGQGERELSGGRRSAARVALRMYARRTRHVRPGSASPVEVRTPWGARLQLLVQRFGEHVNECGSC